MIAVDGFSNERGSFSIRYDFQPNDIKFVSVKSSAGGEVEGPSGNLISGTTISLTATPEFGFEFKGWSGSVDSAENPLEILVDANLEIQAQFGPVTVGENFESGELELPFEFVGAPWEITEDESLSGNASIRSGSIMILPDLMEAFPLRLSSSVISHGAPTNSKGNSNSPDSKFSPTVTGPN